MIKDTSTILDYLETKVGESPIQKNAWEMLSEVGLPRKKSETYKFTPIIPILEKNISWNHTGKDGFDKAVLYSEEGSHVVFINGEYVRQYSSLQHDLQLEVTGISKGKHDPFSLLNTCLAKEEVKITSGTKKTVFIYHFSSNGISNPRIKIKIKKNDTLRIIEKIIASTAYNSFTNSYIQFEADKNSFACHTKIQDYNEKVFTHETVVAHVNRDGQFTNSTFSFDGAMIRNNLTINLEDENCESQMYGLFLLNKKSHVDNNTTVDHSKPNSYSNELYKGILDEKSTAVFNGKIYVRQDAQKTNAFQSNNNILLSEDATIHTKPQLEIWADDVKCSHGCTSGQLDKDAIFYLRTRGIDEKGAKAMLLDAFAVETMKHVKVESIRKEIQELIRKKLA